MDQQVAMIAHEDEAQDVRLVDLAGSRETLQEGVERRRRVVFSHAASLSLDTPGRLRYHVDMLSVLCVSDDLPHPSRERKESK